MNGFFSTLIGGSVKAFEIGVPAAATGGGSLIATGAIAGASLAAGKIAGGGKRPMVVQSQPQSALSGIPLWGWVIGGLAGMALLVSL